GLQANVADALSIESRLARPEVKEAELLTDELIVSCALKDAENVMPSLDGEACSWLEILYRLPVSVLRLRGRFKQEDDNDRGNDSWLAACDDACSLHGGG